jgi:hypothetical protein
MSFYLYRATPNGNQVLSLSDSDKITFGSQDKAVPLSFVGLSGHQARILTTGKIYFPIISQADGIYYIYTTSNSLVFSLSKSTDLPGRIFIYLPIGHTYTVGCNLNGQFFIYGSTLDNSILAEFDNSILDIIWLTPVDGSQNIIAKDCISNCDGKKCTDDDGCGNPCGCPIETNASNKTNSIQATTGGQICLESGVCQNNLNPNLPMPVCLDASQYPDSSGSGTPIKCEGFCFGHCPDGYQCIRDKYGNYNCIEVPGTNAGSINTIFIVALFVIAGLSLVIIIVWLSNSYIKRSYLLNTDQSNKGQNSSVNSYQENKNAYKTINYGSD